MTSRLTELTNVNLEGTVDAEEYQLNSKIVLRSKDGLEPGAFELSQAPAAAYAALLLALFRCYDVG